MVSLPNNSSGLLRLYLGTCKLGYRHISIGNRLSANAADSPGKDTRRSLELVPDDHPKKILEREFPNHFRDGQFVSRMSYVEFIDEALAKAKELGIEKNLDTYKELLRIFPAGKFVPRYKAEFGLFHAPQQLAANRILFQMHMNGLSPDSDFEKLIIGAFTKRSDIWIMIARANYWSMKLRNLDKNPLPEKLPKKPHQLAKLGIVRMLEDHQSLVTVTNTSKVPDSVDKTWVVTAQSPTQQAIIDRLDEKSTIYIEEGGFTFVGSQYLTYYLLKYYVDEATIESKEEPKPDYNYNTVKMKFFGKPIEEKLESIKDKHYADGSYILAIAATGTSSQDSLLSWLKILQHRNPKLSKLNVVFRMSRQSPEIVEYNDSDRQQHDRRRAGQQGEAVS